MQSHGPVESFTHYRNKCLVVILTSKCCCLSLILKKFQKKSCVSAEANFVGSAVYPKSPTYQKASPAGKLIRAACETASNFTALVNR